MNRFQRARILLIGIIIQTAGLTTEVLNAFADGVELHAHLFMKEGMTWAFRGSFSDSLRAKTWTDRLSSQANSEALEESKLSIIVVALYAHPLFTLSMRDSIRRQIDLASEFIRKHPQWIIAKTPAQARRALTSGKRVLVLSLEGAHGIIETDDDVREFVGERGIRIVTLLHLTDDPLGGVALLKGIKALSSPISLVEALWSRERKGSLLSNPNGLTAEGEKLARSLIEHGVWIDLAHSSDRSQRALIHLLMEKNHPLLHTHTVMRKYHQAERGIGSDALQALAKQGGYIGIMPSKEMLEGTPTPAECSGDLGALASQIKELSRLLPSESIALGSDINGGITHLEPGGKTNCITGTSLDNQGLWNIGQEKDVWKGLIHLGIDPNHPSRNVSAFLEQWERVIP